MNKDLPRGCELIVLSDQHFYAHPTGALYWPQKQALIVADLHLEKASHFAEKGRFLPPYDSAETLNKLEAAARFFEANQIFTLGDSFHDNEALRRMPAAIKAQFSKLLATFRWNWITGNHDEEPEQRGWRQHEVLRFGQVDLRHITTPDLPSGVSEISGHFHPKAKVKVRGRVLSRPCFIYSRNRLIMPAFGSLTGGLAVRDPAISTFFQEGAVTLLLGKENLHRYRLPPSKKTIKSDTETS